MGVVGWVGWANKRRKAGGLRAAPPSTHMRLGGEHIARSVIREAVNTLNLSPAVHEQRLGRRLSPEPVRRAAKPSTASERLSSSVNEVPIITLLGLNTLAVRQYT